MTRKRLPAVLLAAGLTVLAAAALLAAACGDGRREIAGRFVTLTPSHATPSIEAPAPLDLGPQDQGLQPAVVEGLDDAYSQEISELTNQARQSEGLAPLSLSGELQRAARAYAQVLATNDWFDHEGPDGSTIQGRDEAAGYTNWTLLAENLARGSGAPKPSAVAEAWLQSPDHRRNILHATLQEMGTACFFLSGQPPRFWCVQEFGTRQSPQPTPTPSPRPTPTPTATPTPTPVPTPIPPPPPTPTPTPTPEPTPTPTPTPVPGAITILKDTDPDIEDVTFEFEGDLGDFFLKDDESLTFDGLEPRSYTVTEEETPGWQLTRLTCFDATSGSANVEMAAEVDITARRVTVDLQPGQRVLCWFDNDQLPTLTPTATPTPTPVPTPTPTTTPTPMPVP